ncbi:hypothetical protein J6590_021575 [Homalodisca vitripennis]|nr:hypothetical protein J6590_021575 [Homalodisca vitripennis]
MTPESGAVPPAISHNRARQPARVLPPSRGSRAVSTSRLPRTRLYDQVRREGVRARDHEGQSAADVETDRYNEAWLHSDCFLSYCTKPIMLD